MEIVGNASKKTIESNVPICSAITAVDLPSGETLLLRANESTILGKEGNTLLSVAQMREMGLQYMIQPKDMVVYLVLKLKVM